MSFRANNKNPVPALVTLKTALTEQDDVPDLINLGVDLDVYVGEVNLDGATIEVGLKQVIVDVDPQGLEAMEKSRLGRLLRPINVTVNATRETVLTASAEKVAALETEAGADIQTLTAALKVKAALNNKETHAETVTFKEERSVEHTFTRIKYAGNDTWKIEGIEEPELNGTYLEQDQPLCQLKIKDRYANRLATTVSVHARQQDIRAQITADNRLLRKRLNAAKEKVLSILMAEALHEVSAVSEYTGLVCFATSESADEE